MRWVTQWVSAPALNPKTISSAGSVHMRTDDQGHSIRRLYPLLVFLTNEANKDEWRASYGDQPVALVCFWLQQIRQLSEETVVTAKEVAEHGH